MDHDVKDLALAPSGKARIEWADLHMPVLRAVRRRFEDERPLRKITVAACLHVTSETANLMRALKAGGADAAVCASNPLSTQDDVAASLVKDFGIPAFAIKGEDEATYYKHLRACLARNPHLTLDDGADLVSLIHKERPDLAEQIVASMEETTTGVVRLRALEREGGLRIPVVSVNDADTKYLFDNRYGTGQSTLDGIIRSTNLLIAGKTFVVVGYGWCGRGLAGRARGLGAKVVVTEVNAIRALEAAMDGFQVMPMVEAAKIGDVFCSVTGNKHVLRREHFIHMKDGSIICNSGHFNVEIDLEALQAITQKSRRNIRPYVDEFTLQSGVRLYVLGEGRLVNLACAEGHPSAVMDMSFATQALMAEYVVKHKGKLAKKVHEVPKEIEEWIAKLKLESMGIAIDVLTGEQAKYMDSWQEGT